MSLAELASSNPTGNAPKEAPLPPRPDSLIRLKSALQEFTASHQETLNRSRTGEVPRSEHLEMESELRNLLGLPEEVRLTISYDQEGQAVRTNREGQQQIKGVLYQTKEPVSFSINITTGAVDIRAQRQSPDSIGHIFKQAR